MEQHGIGCQKQQKTRCGWVNCDPLYHAYHDDEWGRPLHDGQCLFELLCLEGQQAGLSWITVLKKRESYRQAFHHFQPQYVAAMDDVDLERLMQNVQLIRNRSKLTAIIANAQAYLRMEQQGEDFAQFIWSFVDGKTQHNRPATLSEIPVNTPTSLAMSKALKKRGFKFVGPTICYAYMQSSGMVNDHVACCYLAEK